MTGTIGRAWAAREKAAQAQELWMGALNLPSAADIERLTRRLRSVSQRLEGVEDGVQRLGRTLVQSSRRRGRLQAIEEQLARSPRARGAATGGCPRTPGAANAASPRARPPTRPPEARPRTLGAARSTERHG